MWVEIGLSLIGAIWMGLPETKVGTFSQALMNKAKQRGWAIISMKKTGKKSLTWE